MKLNQIIASTLAGIALTSSAYATNPSLSYENAPASAISTKGLEFIKSAESYSPTNYFCRTGHKTIGYGHVVKKGENFNYMSKDEANVLLLQDLAHVESTIDLVVKVPLNQNEYAALASFAHNVGANAFSESTLVRKLNQGDKVGAANEFDKWVYGLDSKTKKKIVIKGLVNRRAKDKALFLSN